MSLLRVKKHSGGSPSYSPIPIRFKSKNSKNKAQNEGVAPEIHVSNDEEHESLGGVPKSPFLGRAVRYSENSPSRSNSHESPESDRKQSKKKTFLNPNFIIGRLRSGSWHGVTPLVTSTTSSPESLRRHSEDSPEALRRSHRRTHSQGESGKSGKSGLDCRADQSNENLLVGSSESVCGNLEDSEISGLIRHILESHLCKDRYSPDLSSERCKLLARILEKSVKSRLDPKKMFKIAAVVYMGELRDDGIKLAAQCSWQPKSDHFAMATYETESMFVAAVVLATSVEEVESQDTAV